MPSAARSLACRFAFCMPVRTTVVVRSRISTGLCSTQPACGRICSCSNWWRATSLPPWSKIMKRVLVVPWSTAPTKSATTCLHGFGCLLGGDAAGLRLAGDGQDPADQPLVQPGAEHAADDRGHDRNPEVQITGLIA